MATALPLKDFLKVRATRPEPDDLVDWLSESVSEPEGGPLLRPLPHLVGRRMAIGGLATSWRSSWGLEEVVVAGRSAPKGATAPTDFRLLGIKIEYSCS